jgi:hypothetical protein
MNDTFTAISRLQVAQSLTHGQATTGGDAQRKAVA